MTFLIKDLSGREGHYEMTFEELITDAEFADDEQLIYWAETAEVGNEFTEYNNIKIICIHE